MTGTGRALIVAACLIGGAAAALGQDLGAFKGDPAQIPPDNQKPRTPPPKAPPRTPRKDHPQIVIVNNFPGSFSNRLGTAGWDQHRLALQQALSAPVGQVFPWVNGMGSGQAAAVGDRFIDGMNCRDVAQRISTTAVQQEATSTFCLGPAGDWLLVAGP